MYEEHYVVDAEHECVRHLHQWAPRGASGRQAFEDAKIEGWKRAQHRYIGAGGSGKHDDIDAIPARAHTLSIMYVEPGQGNAPHTHEVEETFFVLKGHLDAFDQLDAPPFIEQLVVQQGLRDRLAEIAQNDAFARVEPVALVDDPVPFIETELTVDDVLLAAEALAAQGEPFTGIQLGEWMLESVPENPDALAGQGWLLARSATPDAVAPAEIGLTFLDRALGVESAHPEALVYRAFVHNFLGDPVSAAADLAAFDDLDTRPADLRGLILAFGLRESIGAS